jgi:uncharacterized protein YfaS (alpha-2-macroglobulin family)
MMGSQVTRHTTIADRRWHVTRVACAGPGVQLVELRASGVAPVRALASASDLRVTVVARSAGSIAWITSRATGRAIVGARVTVTSAAGRSVASEVSNERGLVRLPAIRDESWVVAAELGPDCAVARAEPTRPPRDDANVVPPAPSSSARLSLHARQSASRPGERLAYVAAARAPDGTPWPGARVQWALHRHPHPVQLTGYDGFTFAPEPRDDDDVIIADGAASTNAHGELAIAARDPAPLRDQAVDYVLTAAAFDAAGAAANAAVTVTSEPAALRLGLRADQIAPAAGVPFDLALVAVAPDGAPIAAVADLTITRIERRCGGVATPTGMRSRCREVRRALFDREIELTAGAAREERIELAEPGFYVLRAHTRDGESTERAIWVPGAGAVADDDGAVTAVADGARLGAITGRSHANALVVLERDGRLDAQVTELAAAGDPVELAGAAGASPVAIALAGDGWFATAQLGRSWSSSQRFLAMPPAYPVSSPLAPITR